MRPELESREQRGLEIAATAKIIKKGNAWTIPSQSGKGRHTVRLQADLFRCTCPDHETHGGKCKHIYAVEFARQRARKSAQPDVANDQPSRSTRKTYPQDWRAYNLAQTTEKERFVELLHDLCGGIVEASPQMMGRPRLPIQDAVFAACFKVYSTVSCRRFMTDLRGAHEKGLISRVPHFNTIFNYLENPDLTPIRLNELIKFKRIGLRDSVGPCCVDLKIFDITHYVERRVFKGRGIADELKKGLIKVAILPFVLPGEVILLPHIRESATTTNFVRSFLKGKMLTCGIVLNGRWVIEQSAQIQKMLVRNLPLSKICLLPFLDERVWRHKRRTSMIGVHLPFPPHPKHQRHHPDGGRLTITVLKWASVLAAYERGKQSVIIGILSATPVRRDA